jgi:hypothetical protein
MSCFRIASCVLLALAACDLGDVRDLGSMGAPDADVVEPGPDAASVPCADPVANVGGGEHNPGQACVACHAADGGPDFTLAGTLYADPGGVTPLAGATIVVIDAGGASIEMVTQSNGNFWTSEPLTFPVHVSATRCPDTTPMVSAVSSADCNAGGCHATGSSTGRIHLP